MCSRKGERWKKLTGAWQTIAYIIAPTFTHRTNNLEFHCIYNFTYNWFAATEIMATARPTVSVLGADGAASGDSHPLPNVFRAPIRLDIVQYVQRANIPFINEATANQALKQTSSHRNGQEQTPTVRRQ